MEKLRNIIKQLKQICKEEEITVSPDMFLDCCVRILNTYNIQDNKQSTEEKATEKQIVTLNKLKIKIPENVTKKEAYQLIKNKLG